VQLRPVEDYNVLQRGRLSTYVRADNTFAIEGAVSGAYSVDLIHAATSPWVVKSVKLGQQDLLEGPLRVPSPPADVSELVIELTDSSCQIRGKASDSSGTGVAGSIILLPANRALWYQASDRIRAVTSTADGGFYFDDLAPGDYILAFHQGELPNRSSWTSPQVLTIFAATGVRLRLREGEMKEQNIAAGR